MKINIKKLLNKILIIVCIAYAAIIMINQQKQLNIYRDNIATTEKEIDYTIENVVKSVVGISKIQQSKF